MVPVWVIAGLLILAKLIRLCGKNKWAEGFSLQSTLMGRVMLIPVQKRHLETKELLELNSRQLNQIIRDHLEPEK